MKMIGIGMFIMAAFMSGTPATAQNQVERGKELFNSARLGTNGKSCATCHPNGSRLEETATYDDGELVKVINQCIKEMLNGKPPAAKSADMKALVAYIRTVAKP